MGIDSQRAEGGGGNVRGNAPAVAKLNFALPHEEPQAVLKHRNRAGSRLPQVWVLVVVRLGGCRVVGHCRQRLRAQNGHCGGRQHEKQRIQTEKVPAIRGFK